MKFLPLLLGQCANLHNMVKLILNRLKQDKTGKIMFIAKHDEITRLGITIYPDDGIFKNA